MTTTNRDDRRQAWEDSAESLGLEPGPRVRPGLIAWLRYAFWGRLGPRHHGWVLYDATCSTWVARHVGRLITVAALPIVLVIVLLPGPLGVRVLTAVVAGLGGFLFAVVWVNEATDQRVRRDGWQVGVGPELRERRVEIEEWMAAVRRL